MAETNDTKKLKVHHPSPASADFWDVLDCNHSPEVKCESCGRIVWGNDVDDDDDWSVEERLKGGPPPPSRAEQLDRDPDAVFADTDSVAWTYVFGHHVVYGCPYHMDGRIESILVDNQEFIVEWIKRRRNRLKKQYSDELHLLGQVLDEGERE